MRTCFLCVALLGAGVALGDETSALQAIVRQFESPDARTRHDASLRARAEVKRLLRPLYRALEHEDPEVRRRARAALQGIVPVDQTLPKPPGREVPSWHEWKATGQPDAVAAQDHPNAWASRAGRMGLQWLELGYRDAQRVHAIRIFEVHQAGAVVEIETVDDKGVRRSVWKGRDPLQQPGVFTVKIPPTKYRVKLVRVILDTNRTNSWNEIDAVEIVGPKSRDWAATATASSSYARR